MKHILVPIGSTENVKNTLQYAIDFATEINAKVFVFRAYNVQFKIFDPYCNAGPTSRRTRGTPRM